MTTEAFIKEAAVPLKKASKTCSLTIYAIGQDAVIYQSLLGAAFTRDGRDVLPLAVEVEGDNITGLHELRKAGQARHIHGRYQVLVAARGPADDEESYRAPIKVAYAIRGLEASYKWEDAGISFVFGDPPAHRRLSEVTRMRLLDPRQRDPLQEEKVLYGPREVAYVDGFFDKLLGQPLRDGTVRELVLRDHAAVIECNGLREGAHYLAYRLCEETGKLPQIVVENGEGNIGEIGSDRIVIVPGKKNQKFLDKNRGRIGTREVVWVGGD